MVLRVRNLVLTGVAAVAALIPLYGDPRSAPVTHPEWARMMLQGMDMEEALQTSASASRVFSTLSWKESLWLRAAQYMRAEGVELQKNTAEPTVASVSELGEVVYPLSVVRRGNYRLRAKLSGQPTAPAIAEITKADDGAKPEQSYTLVPAPVSSWLAPDDAMHLEPGTYYATFALPRGTVLEQFEISPPCVTPVEPLDGWKPADVLDAEDLAVTMVKALDREQDLPPADTAIEVNGSDFRIDEEQPAYLQASTNGVGFDGLWLKAGLHGSRAVLFVDLPADGLYSMTAFGLRGAGMQWLADDCRTSVLCPADATLDEIAGWFPVLSAHFSKGRHFFNVALGRGAAIERIRFERKKGTGADYVATLRRMGFDAGEGPVSRSRAADALDFLRKRYLEDVSRSCTQIEPEENPDTRVALLQGQPITQPQQPQTTPPGVGAPPPIIGGPVLVPPPTPPPTLPCVPPASPLTPDPCPSPSP